MCNQLILSGVGSEKLLGFEGIVKSVCAEVIFKSQLDVTVLTSNMAPSLATCVCYTQTLALYDVIVLLKKDIVFIVAK